MTPQGLQRLIQDEGSRAQPYDDKTGLTIHLGPAGGNVTIGVGRNLTARPLTQAEIEYLLQNDLAEDWAYLLKYEPELVNLPPVWQDVVEMVDFNTGNALGFPKMIAAMLAGDAETAAQECAVSNPRLAERYGRMQAAIRAGSWG